MSSVKDRGCPFWGKGKVKKVLNASKRWRSLMFCEKKNFKVYVIWLKNYIDF